MRKTRQVDYFSQQQACGQSPGLLPLLESLRFHVLFYSLMGFFSPFTHGTTSLSVTYEYLALQGGPCGFTRDSTCPLLLGSERKQVMLSILDSCHLECSTSPLHLAALCLYCSPTTLFSRLVGLKKYFEPI